MHIISVRNVAEAWPRGLRLIELHGKRAESRVGPVLVLDEPVLTEYKRPKECVLFCSSRNANPMFHMLESLWMLAGESDATWLDLFIRDFSERFAQPDGHIWGAYGDRWRNHFDIDQLQTVISRLKANPNDRRVVLTMWDPIADLVDRSKSTEIKDMPCNTHVYPRIVQGALDITVCCRSNDIVWGAYGANAVQFAFLQEYLASSIGVEVGLYRQFSNNYHMYEATMPKQYVPYAHGHLNPYIGETYHFPLVSVPEAFDQEVKDFVMCPCDDPYENLFLSQVAWPMYETGRLWREKDPTEAIVMAGKIQAPDWRNATLEWLWRKAEGITPRPEGYPAPHAAVNP